MEKVEKITISEAIKQYLVLLEGKGILSFTRNHYTNKRKKSNVHYGKIGMPDYFLFLSGGRTVHMLVLSRHGRLSRVQIEYQQKVESLGHTHVVVKDLREVQDVIARYSL